MALDFKEPYTIFLFRVLDNAKIFTGETVTSVVILGQVAVYGAGMHNAGQTDTSHTLNCPRSGSIPTRRQVSGLW